MRFLLCLVIWFIFVGGLYYYTSRRDRAYETRAVAAPVDTRTEMRVALELTPTFSVQDDPFALKTEEQQGPFEIRINGVGIASADLGVSRGQTLVIADLNIALGEHNEVFIKASPPVAESQLDHGIRVRLLDRERVLADKTVWSSGGLVSGTVIFSLPTQAESDHEQ